MIAILVHSTLACVLNRMSPIMLLWISEQNISTVRLEFFTSLLSKCLLTEYALSMHVNYCRGKFPRQVIEKSYE